MKYISFLRLKMEGPLYVKNIRIHFSLDNGNFVSFKIPSLFFFCNFEVL
jgi:hypothetical protein